jgi:DNA-directed RNA polymerase subunit beta'
MRVKSVQRLDFLTEEEYLNILDTLPADNQYLDDFDPNKFVAKMGECIMDLLARIDLDQLSYQLRHSANNETSKQRKTEALKDYKLLNFGSLTNRENRPEDDHESGSCYSTRITSACTTWRSFCNFRFK